MQYTVLTGTEKVELPLDAEPIRADPNTVLTVTVEVVRKAPPDVTPSFPLSPQRLDEIYGPATEAIQGVHQLAQTFNLEFHQDNPESRFINLTGKLADFEQLFDVQLYDARWNGESIRYRVGPVSVPDFAKDWILGVFGLDTRSQVNPHVVTEVRTRPVPAITARSISGISQDHAFPDGDGAGAVIAIVEFGGSFSLQDVRAARTEAGIVEEPAIVKHPPTRRLVRGNSPADNECAMDVQIASVLAPRATIMVHFGGTSNQEVINTIHAVTRTAPTVISISWGKPEAAWNEASMRAIDSCFEDARALGTICLVSSGDHGKGALGLQPEFPATSPFACACGGVMTDSQGGDTVWRLRAPNMSSGGGFSQRPTNLRPQFQDGLAMPQNIDGTRGIPDLSGYACTKPGFRILVGSTIKELGGTSAVPPLYAALIARIAGDKLFNFSSNSFNDLLYKSVPTIFKDCQTGGNDQSVHGPRYRASAGWDPCTGNGKLNGVALVTVLAPFLSPRPN